MDKNIRSLVVAILSLGAAASADAASLLKVYQDALTSDPTLRQAEANRNAALEVRPQARAALLPQITGSAARQESESTRVGVQQFNGVVIPGGATSSATDSTLKNWSVDLRQSVFSWANWVTFRRANQQVAQAEADYRAAQQDLAVRVAQRYFDALDARYNVEAQEASLEAISRQLEQAEKRFEVGLIAITDVQEARAARDNGTAAVIAAKRALATAEEQLREITGQAYEKLARPSTTLPLSPPTPADPEKWVQTAMDQNATLQSSRLAAEVARENVRIAFGGHLPSVDLVASRGGSDSSADITNRSLGTVSPSENNGNSKSISLQFSLPIFSGGATQSRVRESEFRWIAAKERVTAVSRQTERQARDAYLGVISEISRVNALRQGLESSQTALRATEAGYEVGTRTAVDVLGSRRDLAASQTSFASARNAYLLNVIQLRAASGTLDESVLREIDQWLSESETLKDTTEAAAPAAPAAAPAPAPAPRTP